MLWALRAAHKQRTRAGAAGSIACVRPLAGPGQRARRVRDHGDVDRLLEQRAGAHVPARLIGWATPIGSQLRVQQLLARLGYLPLSWRATNADVAGTIRSQVAAAVEPPEGRFVW